MEISSLKAKILSSYGINITVLSPAAVNSEKILHLPLMWLLLLLLFLFTGVIYIDIAP